MEHLAAADLQHNGPVNCFFYFKTGACCNGDNCFRRHARPDISPTLLLRHMYRPRTHTTDHNLIQEHFEDFYEDIFEELAKFGEVEDLIVSDNLADHMIGNVYVMFKHDGQAAAAAAAALEAFKGKAYCGERINVEFSPVRAYSLGLCRKFEEGYCDRGRFCNYVHAREIGRGLRRKLFGRGCRRGRSVSRERGGDYRDSGATYGNERTSVDRHARYDGDTRRRQYCTRSPVREESEERRAKIERWNREREREGRW